MNRYFLDIVDGGDYATISMRHGRYSKVSDNVTINRDDEIHIRDPDKVTVKDLLKILREEVSRR